jgi:hypothetical protein
MTTGVRDDPLNGSVHWRAKKLAGYARDQIMITHTSGRSFLRNMALAFLLFVPLVLVSPSKVYGYADPGTGAFVYQAAYAVFLGGTFYLRKLLNRFWGKRK